MLTHAIVSLAIFTDIFYYALIIPVVPFSLTVQVGIPEEDVQRWTSILLACYSLALFVGSPIFGFYADHTSSRRWPLLIGLVVLAGSTLFLCLGKTIGLLVLGRLLQGFSAAIVWSVGCALLVDTVGDSVGVAMGYVNLAMSMGLLIAPVIGGAVYEAAGYYAVFYVAFGIVVLDILLRLIMIEKKVARQWESEDDGVPITSTARNDAEKATLSPDGEPNPTTTPGESSTVQSVTTGTDVIEHTSQGPSPRDVPPENSTLRESNTRSGSITSQNWSKKDAIIKLLKSPRLMVAFYGIMVEAGIM